MLNALTVDVEEYFHPTEVHSLVDQKRWASLPTRVDAATHRVLDLLASHEMKATFFVLGWVAHRHPRLIREIVTAGHEIGSHGYAHRLIFEMTSAEFRRDTQDALRATADACGVPPRLYRATSFSVTARTLWALDILAECGFTHDSSICPVVHDRYGIPGFSRHAVVIETSAGPICEVPVATVQLFGGRVAPVGGGAYLRLLPYRYTAAGLRRVNLEEGRPACVYLHPWEMDPDLPQLNCGLVSRLRTYGCIRGMEAKVKRLLSEFRFSTLTSVYPAGARAGIASHAS